MDLSELLLGYVTRSAAQKILRISVHRESDYFPDVLFTLEDHDHSVYAGSHSCMRRSTKLECVVERTEIGLELLFGIACDLECLLHDLKIMVSDSAGRKLYAVADDVVLVSKDLSGLFCIERLKAALRH